MKTRELAYKILEHVLTYFGNLHFSMHPFFLYHRKDKPERCFVDSYKELQAVVEPGDILLQHKKGQLLNFFIPGRFSHSGIYVGNIGDKVERVIHASSPKVQVTDLIYFLDCDEIAVLRPNISQEEKDLAVQNAIESIDFPYDYTFIFEEGKKRPRLSCSGLIYNSFLHVLSVLRWKLKIRSPWFFRKLFIPDDMLPKNGSNVKIILRKKF